MIENDSGKMIQSNVIYELREDEVLELYYSEPRLAALMNLDIIRLIDCHLVVNLKQFVTPKTHRLTALAKRNPSACCVGIQYLRECKEGKGRGKKVNCTLDLLIQASGFMEESVSVDGGQSDYDIDLKQLKK